jgi:hypothetical protein
MEASARENKIIAVDPGTEKFGVAVLDYSGNVIAKSVINKVKFPEAIGDLILRNKPKILVTGDGTGSDWVFGVLSSLRTGEVMRVEEHKTTLDARELAWKENPPAGIYKILPKIFWPVPPDLDSWAAVVIARRALEEKGIL